jgi:hypothetical protein
MDVGEAFERVLEIVGVLSEGQETEIADILYKFGESAYQDGYDGAWDEVPTECPRCGSYIEP